MKTQIMTSCRYGCLAVLAALLVTGVPSASKAIDTDLLHHDVVLLECSLFNGQCSPSGLAVRCKRTNPKNGQAEVCYVECSNGKWGRPHGCTRKGETTEDSNSEIPAEL